MVPHVLILVLMDNHNTEPIEETTSSSAVLILVLMDNHNTLKIGHSIGIKAGVLILVLMDNHNTEQMDIEYSVLVS